MTRSELLAVRASRRLGLARVGETSGPPALLFAAPIALGGVGIVLALFGHPVIGLGLAGVSALGYYLLANGYIHFRA